MTNIEFTRARRANRKNAPSFIYEILYGEPKFIPGREPSHKEKMWNGIAIDEHIPTEALDKLNSIEEIELRSSCEGSGPERPTFLIFRFRIPYEEKELERFVRAMNAIGDLRCGFDVGNMGFYRVGVTADLWYSKDPERFQRWWMELPIKIQIALAINHVLASEHS